MTLRVLSEKDLDVLVNLFEGVATLLKGIKKLMVVFGKLFESRNSTLKTFEHGRNKKPVQHNTDKW